MNLASPFCAHVFTDSVFEGPDGEELESFTCGCGYTYRLTDLQKFDKLKTAVAKSQANLADHVKSMALFSRERKPSVESVVSRPSTSAFAENRPPVANAAASVPPVAAANPVAAQVTPPKAKKPVLKRARIRISPQQWLILGASILVLIASSIFVANNLYKMPRWEFLSITTGVALATGFGAKWGRQFSVLLSNFLAAFSASMIFFSLQNIGVYIFGGFEWNTAPPWYLAINFGVMTIGSYFLARISRNFGWKGIALLTWLGAGFSLVYGPLTDIQGETLAGEADYLNTPVFIGLSLTALGIPLLLKLLRNIPAFETKKPEDKEYEAALFRREEITLWRAGQFLVLLLGVLGVAKLFSINLVGFWSVHAEGSLPTMALLAAIWLAAAIFSNWWSPSLTKDLSDLALARKISWIIASITLASTLYDAAFMVTTLNSGIGTWPIATVLAIVFSAAFITAENLPGRLAPTRAAAWTGLSVLASLWLQNSSSDSLVYRGAYLIGLSLFGASTQLWAKHKLNIILNQATNLVGLLLFSIGSNIEFSNTDQVAPEAVTTFVVATGSSMLFGLLQNYISTKGESVRADGLALALINAIGGGVVGLIALVSAYSHIASTVMPSSVLLLLVVALLRASVNFIAPLKTEQNKRLVTLQSYVASGIIALNLLVLWFTTSWLVTSASAMIVLAVVAAYHYGFGILEKSKGLLAIGFVSIQVGILASWDSLAHLSNFGWALIAASALSLVVALTDDAFSSKIAGRSELSRFNLVLFGSVGSTTIGAFLHAHGLGSLGEGQALWILQAWLAILTLATFAAPAVGKLGASNLAAQLSRCLGASYGIIGFSLLVELDFASKLQDASLHLLVAGAAWAAGTAYANQKKQHLFWLIASYAGFLTVAQALGNLTSHLLKSDAPESYSVWYAVMFAACTWVARKQLGSVATYLMIDAPVVIAASISLANALTRDITQGVSLHRGAIALAVLALHAAWRTRTKSRAALLAYSYVANIGLMLTIGRELELATKWHDLPELYSLPLAVGFALAALNGSKLLGGVKNLFTIDVPILVALTGSLGYALSNDPSSGNSLHRAAVTLGLLAVHAALRSRGKFGLAWLIWAYVAGEGFALAIGRELENATFLHTTPELYAVPAGLALSAVSLVGAARLGRWRRLGAQDLPVILAAVISLGYALAHDPSTGQNLVRALVALLVLAVLGYWNTRGEHKLQWLGLAYVAGAGFALTAGRELVLATNLSQVIEFYSVPIVLSVLLANRVLLRIRSFESSLFIWGVPLAGAVLPSAFKAADSFNTRFEQLSTDQIARTIIVLLVSAALLVIGVRRGNLAQTAVGVVGLMVISWVRVQDVNSSLRLESNALLLAFTLWLVLWLIKRFAKTGGSSLLYVGVPVAIAMAPSLVTAWAALNHPTLTPVDWWRFGILLAASLVLLTVGSLREQAGMFFPGLVGVISTALPYGFNRIATQSWFLWVILLLIAGVLVWLAVRLEQMKKVGKESTAWLKALK